MIKIYITIYITITIAVSGCLLVFCCALSIVKRERRECYISKTTKARIFKVYKLGNLPQNAKTAFYTIFWGACLQTPRGCIYVQSSPEPFQQLQKTKNATQCAVIYITGFKVSLNKCAWYTSKISFLCLL